MTTLNQSCNVKIRSKIAQKLKISRTEIIDAWYRSQFSDELIKKYSIIIESEEQRWICDTFLAPLLNLMIEYIRTGEDRYRDVYQDERLRYAPHRASPEERRDFFVTVLAQDEQTLLRAIKDSHSRTILEMLLTEIHAPLIAPLLDAPIHLLALGDCLMNELRVFLPVKAREMGFSLDMRCLYFSAAMSRNLSVNEVVSHLSKNKVDLISMSFLSFEGIPAYSLLLREADRLSNLEIEKRAEEIISVIRTFIDDLRKHTNAPFLIHDASGLRLTRLRRCLPFLPALSPGRKNAIQALNQGIRELVNHFPKCTLIREQETTKAQGYRRCSESVIPKKTIGKGQFHTSHFGRILTNEYLPILDSYHALHKTKVLLIDFDHTLWSGVMGEGEVTHHFERQKLLKELKEAGILLVAVSKNNPENIRWKEIALSPEDFVLLKINWDLKAKSIQDAATELNLGLDSFVFIDDNPVELELVKKALPDVVCLNSLKEDTWASLRRLLIFPNTQATEESKTRTQMYRAQVARNQSIHGTLDYPKMMASLGLKLTFGPAHAHELDRLHELISRTNQFNTTTVRYSKTELGHHLNNPNIGIYVSDLEDKFGKLGLVATAIVRREGRDRVIDSFVMSCRAMGFGLENLMLRLIAEKEAAACSRFIGRFIPTDRNSPCSSLFASNQFKQANETEWHLESIEYLPEKPNWFEIDLRRMGTPSTEKM